MHKTHSRHLSQAIRTAVGTDMKRCEPLCQQPPEPIPRTDIPFPESTHRTGTGTPDRYEGNLGDSAGPTQCLADPMGATPCRVPARQTIDATHRGRSTRFCPGREHRTSRRPCRFRTGLYRSSTSGTCVGRRSIGLLGSVASASCSTVPNQRRKLHPMGSVHDPSGSRSGRMPNAGHHRGGRPDPCPNHIGTVRRTATLAFGNPATQRPGGGAVAYPSPGPRRPTVP